MLIEEESSSLKAIKVPLTKKALRPLEGLIKTGIIVVPLTRPKSKSLLLIFPFAI